MYSSKIIKMQTPALVATLVALICLASTWTSDAKLLHRSRYFDDSPYSNGGGYNMPYGGGAVATGERAIITVRGARNPYDGSAPNKIAIEDNPYRGAYPRGVYDRADGYSRQRMPIYPGQDYGYSGYGNGGYNSGYNSMFGAPSRIAVTGAFPYGYGSRF